MFFTNSGQTTNLATHLRTSHNLQEESGKVQPKIAESFFKISAATGPLPKRRSDEISRAILEYVIDGMQPLALVEKPAFRKLLHVLEPRYQSMGSKTLKKKIEDLFIEQKGALKEDIAKCENVAITHDSWTSINTESYDTVTAHYITDEWEMKSKVLDTKKVEGSHTSENIAGILNEVKSEWQIPGAPLAVSDNAANEVKAFKLLKWPRIPCFGHNLNLIVKNGLAVKDIARLVGKGRSLVSFFHRSSSVNGVLQEKQSLLLPKEQHGLKLVQDVSTRWNSTMDMLQRLTEQMAALHATAIDERSPNDIKNKLFNFQEQALVEATTKILQPFKKATVLLSADTVPTLHMVLPIIVKLESALEIGEDDPVSIQNLKKEMKKDLIKRKTMDMSVYSIASLLHPETKGLNFLTAEEQGKVQNQVCREAAGLLATNVFPVTSVVVKQEPSTQGEYTTPALPSLVDTLIDQSQETPVKEEISSPPLKKPKITEQSDWLDDVIYVQTDISCVKSNEQIATEEMARYIAEPPSRSSPLEWWKDRACIYPTLSKLGKKYLACPASSVPSERIFSLCGNIITKKRAQLAPDNVNMLVFLHKNRK